MTRTAWCATLLPRRWPKLRRRKKELRRDQRTHQGPIEPGLAFGSSSFVPWSSHQDVDLTSCDVGLSSTGVGFTEGIPETGLFLADSWSFRGAMIDLLGMGILHHGWHRTCIFETSHEEQERQLPSAQA